ncbi:Alpha/Beta hydrolase protein [Cladochytrium replicatum]|nr:Alpha/Beta hydrolase protein [Cladochytrium replicatum]
MRTEEYVTSSDGVQIFTASWTPEGVPVIATVTVAHGLGEHILRYEHVFSKWASLGIKVHGIDHRGHGRTVLYGPNKEKKGNLGHTGAPFFADVLRDLHEATQRVKVQGVPHFIFGHSMGGLISLLYAEKYPDDIVGVVSSAPALETGTSSILKLAVGLLSKLSPASPAANGLDVKQLTHSEEEIQKYLADPYVHAMISPTTANAMFKGGPGLISNPQKFTKPVLLTIGGDDKICLPVGVQKFHDAVTVSDKSVVIFPGLFHECHNETSQQETVIKTWSDWIVSHARH